MKKFMKLFIMLSSILYTTAPLFSMQTVLNKSDYEQNQNQNAVIKTINTSTNDLLDEAKKVLREAKETAKKVLSDAKAVWFKVPTNIRYGIYTCMALPFVIMFSVKYTLVQLVTAVLKNPETLELLKEKLIVLLQDPAVKDSLAKLAVDTLHTSPVQEALENQIDQSVKTATNAFSFRSLFGLS